MEKPNEQPPEKPTLTPEEKEKIEKEMKRILTPQQIEAVRELMSGNPKKFNTETTKLAQGIAKRYRLSSEINFYLEKAAKEEIEKLKKQEEDKKSDKK